jgi:hypothetical protein
VADVVADAANVFRAGLLEPLRQRLLVPLERRVEPPERVEDVRGIVQDDRLLVQIARGPSRQQSGRVDVERAFGLSEPVRDVAEDTERPGFVQRVIELGPELCRLEKGVERSQPVPERDREIPHTRVRDRQILFVAELATDLQRPGKLDERAAQCLGRFERR